MTGPARDPKMAADQRQWRREQRQIARMHHPDAGGDPEQFLRLMRELEQRHHRAWSAQPDRPVGKGRSKLRRRLRRYERALRSRLPRQVPGSRRYINL